MWLTTFYIRSFVGHLPCWEDEGFKLGSQMTPDDVLRWWNSECSCHGVTGEGRFQYDQSAVNSAVWMLKNIESLLVSFIWHQVNYKPFKLSAYSPRSIERAQRMNRWLVHTIGSVSTFSDCNRLMAKACRSYFMIRRT